MTSYLDWKMQNIAQLLQAAEFLDRREREAEHGYASTLPMPDELTKKKPRGKKSQGNRSTHNELEKNRRAHLRHCLEKLKDLVPLGSDASRHTTLGLLTKAKSFIKNLEEKDKRNVSQIEFLRREHRHLQRKLEQLSHGTGRYRVRQERSISECSTSTNASTSSLGSSISSRCSEESDEIDIMGGFNSDSDDISSVESLGSEGYGSGNSSGNFSGNSSYSMDDSPYSDDL